MGRNVEIKARAGGLEEALRRAAALADSGPELIVQEDTFFVVSRGRMKLRLLHERAGELIVYERPDAEGPKASRYRIFPTDSPGLLRDLLSESLEVLGTVRKRRHLFLAGQTRIHVDEVEGLGIFVELEVVLREGQGEAEGEAVARRLMEGLGIRGKDLVAGAYLDLLLRRRARSD
jgi:predicted adenylyl cyclase CyaB